MGIYERFCRLWFVVLRPTQHNTTNNNYVGAGRDYPRSKIVLIAIRESTLFDWFYLKLPYFRDSDKLFALGGNTLYQLRDWQIVYAFQMIELRKKVTSFAACILICKFVTRTNSSSINKLVVVCCIGWDRKNELIAYLVDCAGIN